MMTAITGDLKGVRPLVRLALWIIRFDSRLCGAVVTLRVRRPS